MPTPVTRASLSQRALQRADFENSEFITPTELRDLVDTSTAKFYNLQVGLYEDYYTAEYTYPIVSTQDKYPIPPDMMKLRQVFYTDSSNYRVQVPRREISDLTNFPAAYSYYSLPLGYVLRGGTPQNGGAGFIQLFPIPQNQNSTASIFIFYIPEYTPPVDDNLPLLQAISFGWDEWIVNDVAIQIRNKAMMPADDLLRERDLIEAKIRHEAKQRNAGDTAKVRDTGFSRRFGRDQWGSFAKR